MNNTPVDPSSYIAKGTGFHLFVAWTVFILTIPLFFLFSLLATYGLALIGWIWWVIRYAGNASRAHAQLRGSALHITPQQMPDFYNVAHEFAARLGMKDCPEIYLIEDNQQNAFARKFGGKQAIVLVDDVVFGGIHVGNPQALNFIIAHELAHHALGHTGFFRSLLNTRFKQLARLDEFSCDAVANALVGDIEVAKDAFCLLLVGPQLFGSVNRAALDEQSLQVAHNRHSKASEKNLTHPLLLRRYAALVHRSEP